jgi:CRP-like cAMP-binding protein
MNYLILEKAPLFSGMLTDEISSIISLIPHRIRKFKSGTIIALAGDPVNSFMMVIDGNVKGEMVDFTGRVIKIEDIPPSGALATAFLFGNRNKFPVNVVAISDARLLIIEKPEFVKLLRLHDKLLTNFLNMISNRSQFLVEKIKFLSFKTIKGKLAHYILQLSDKGLSEIRFTMTQNNLAEYFGVARPSLARVIGEMEADGIIVKSGKSIRILDRKQLTELTID